MTSNHWSIFHKFHETEYDKNPKYYEQLDTLKSQIETFPTQHQIHILSIIHSHEEQLTENKNGVFINLSNLPLSVIQEVGDYSTYVVQQEKDLQERENKVDEFATSLDQS